mgnify:CR=1 FL=1
MTDQEYVEMIVKEIVDNPEDVKTDKTIDDRGILLSLTLNPEDMGKIIGKGGRTVNSIRKLLHVFGAKTDERINLKIYEPDGGEVRTPAEDDVNSEDVPKKDDQPEETTEVEEVIDDSKVDEPEKATPRSKQHNLDDIPTDVLA